MREKRLLLFPLLSLLLLIISFLLLSFWGYQFFYKTGNTPAKPIATTAGKSITINGTRDSLQKMYTAALGSMDNQSNIIMNRMDTTNTKADINPESFYKLRNEISGLLSNPATNGDLEIARQKIIELQQKITELHNHNVSVEEENKKLNATLKQLVNNKINEPKNKIFTPQKVAQVKTNKSIPLINDFHLIALNVKENREVETALAEQTEKLVGYFTWKNYNYDGNEIFVVVTQPDGHLLQSSAWETGSFVTSIGRKAYSCKVNFEANKSEPARLQFSLSGENFQKGNYNAQLYFNGGLVGKSIKILL